MLTLKLFSKSYLTCALEFKFYKSLRIKLGNKCTCTKLL